MQTVTLSQNFTLAKYVLLWGHFFLQYNPGKKESYDLAQFLFSVQTREKTGFSGFTLAGEPDLPEDRFRPGRTTLLFFLHCIRGGDGRAGGPGPVFGFFQLNDYPGRL
jgi:hypothetical protein